MCSSLADKPKHMHVKMLPSQQVSVRTGPHSTGTHKEKVLSKQDSYVATSTQHDITPLLTEELPTKYLDDERSHSTSHTQAEISFKAE